MRRTHLERATDWEPGPGPRLSRQPTAPTPAPNPALLDGAGDHGPVAPAQLLALQRAAGNEAVVRAVTGGPHLHDRPSVQRQPSDRQPVVVQRDEAPRDPNTATTATTAGQAAPAPAPTGPAVPGGSKTVVAPPTTQGVQVAADDDKTVSPEGQLSSDGTTVTLAVVAHNFNARSGRWLDLLHEPGVSIQVTPGNAPQPVVQAAVAALNAHIRSRGDDLVEISVSPQGQAGPNGVSGSVQAQAELHITATFSITASSTLSAAGHTDATDPSQVRVAGNRNVDLLWQPISIGTLFHLDSGGPAPSRDKIPDYHADDAAQRVITWVTNQVSAADFTAGDIDIDRGALVNQLYDAMRAARGDIAECAMHGMPPANQLPAGLSGGLQRAADLLIQADPSLAHISLVRVSLLSARASGSGESVVRWIPLALGRRGGQ